MPPKLSICVLTFKHADYIDLCLETIKEISQKISIEMILYDDGSNDNIKEKVLSSINDVNFEVRIEVHAHKGVEFISQHVEFLFQLARGKYITILSGDDFLNPYVLIENVQAMDENLEIAICYGLGAHMQLDTGSTSPIMPKHELELYKLNDVYKSLNFLKLNIPNLFVQGAVARAWLFKSDIFDHNLMADDWIMNIKIFQILNENGLAYLFNDKIVFYHGLHKNNSSSDFNSQLKRVVQMNTSEYLDNGNKVFIKFYIKHFIKSVIRCDFIIFISLLKIIRHLKRRDILKLPIVLSEVLRDRVKG